MADAPDAERPPKREAALTLRSVTAAGLVTLISGVVVQLAGVFDAGNNLIGIEALPVPALLVFLPLMVVLAVVGALTKARILSKGELVCVLFAAMIATPLMTMGFWRFQLAGLSSVVRPADWTKFEALPENLWPHGENLFGKAFERSWAMTKKTGSADANMGPGGAKLTNRSADATSALRLRVNLGSGTAAPNNHRPPVAVPGRPYLFTALVRATDLGAEAHPFVRVYADENPNFSMEFATDRRPARATTLRPDGFVRVGSSPMGLPGDAKKAVVFELGLKGQGNAEWRDVRLYDVQAIEAAYKGFTRVTRTEFDSLGLAQQQGVVVVPDSLFSRAGLRYLLGLDYPLADWFAPILRLGLFALLVFAVLFGVALIYRKQWLENERYPLPMARIPLILLGAERSDGGLGARFLKNRWLWLGLGVGVPWCALRVAHGYYPNLPDLSMSVGLKGYFADASWGRTWDNVEFKLYVTFLALGLLMELNVLLSLVLGFFLFRLQFWFGEAQGLTKDQDFPYFAHQILGAYLVYTTLLVFFTRRYLSTALRSAFLGSAGSREVMTRRAGLALVVLGSLGFAAWGWWLDMPLFAVSLLAVHLLMLGFVAAKFRAECGLPNGGFTHAVGGPGSYSVPIEVLLFVPLLGGIEAFGGRAVMLMTVMAAAMLPYSFFNIPGLQVELLEVGRRFGVRTRELAGTALLGFGLAMFIGGWLYLVSLYGFGAANLPGVSDFNDRVGGFRIFNAELASAQSVLDAKAAGQSLAEPTPNTAPVWALGFGGCVTAVITVLRQMFPGFWFHPIGFLVGATEMAKLLWGSLLLAYLIRLAVLRLGGAATVREKLIPAAAGLFLAALLGHAAFIAINAAYFFFNLGQVKFAGFL